MVSFICISSAVNLVSINLHHCEANACRKKIITIGMPCQPYFKTDCLVNRFCNFVSCFFKYIIKFFYWVRWLYERFVFHWLCWIKLSILDIYYYISDCTCMLYFWQVCIVYVCLSVCQADLTWLDSSSRSVSVNSASRCSMLSWKLGLIVFLLSLLWTDRLSVKTIHKQWFIWKKNFSILLIKLKDIIEFVGIILW